MKTKASHAYFWKSDPVYVTIESRIISLQWLTFLQQENRLSSYMLITVLVCHGLENKAISPPFYNIFLQITRFDEKCTYWYD